MTKDWNPLGCQPGNPPDGEERTSNVVQLPRTVVVAKDDERESYESLLTFLSTHADPESEISFLQTDDVFGKKGQSS